MKTCTRCGVSQAEEAFSKDAKRKDGLQPHCKACYREYRLANAERLKAGRSADYARNADRYKAAARRWREENADRKRVLDAAWRVENLDRKRANDRAWYDANVDRKRVYDAERRQWYYPQKKHLFSAQAAKRRATKLLATPPWVRGKDFAKIYETARRLTAETGVIHEVDHIVPLQGRGVAGLHVPWNLRVIPRAENRSKGASFAD